MYNRYGGGVCWRAARFTERLQMSPPGHTAFLRKKTKNNKDTSVRQDQDSGLVTLVGPWPRICVRSVLFSQRYFCILLFF